MAGDQGDGGGVSEVPVALIAAVARNGVIGGGNRLLWRLPSDLKRFRALTMGKPVIMGRKTYESLGRPLPGREIIVVTRDAAFRPEGVDAAASIQAALALGQEKARASGAAEVTVAGGGEIYAQTMAVADRLYITEVEIALDGDARFPPINPAIWRQVSREAGMPEAKDEVGFAFTKFVRIS